MHLLGPPEAALIARAQAIARGHLSLRPGRGRPVWGRVARPIRRGLLATLALTPLDGAAAQGAIFEWRAGVTRVGLPACGDAAVSVCPLPSPTFGVTLGPVQKAGPRVTAVLDAVGVRAEAKGLDLVGEYRRLSGGQGLAIRGLVNLSTPVVSPRFRSEFGAGVVVRSQKRGGCAQDQRSPLCDALNERPAHVVSPAARLGVRYAPRLLGSRLAFDLGALASRVYEDPAFDMTFGVVWR